MEQQDNKWTVDLYWNGYCPECWLKREKEKMRLNHNDFFECEKSGLQIVLTMPNIFASILTFRGKAKWRTNPEYANELANEEILCYPTSDNVPLMGSKLGVDFEQFESSQGIEDFIIKKVR